MVPWNINSKLSRNQCLMVAWRYSRDSYGVNVGWLVCESDDGLVLTCSGGTEIPPEHAHVVTIPWAAIEEIRQLVMVEELCQGYRPFS